MLQQGFHEIKDFEWKIIEEDNRLNVKYWLLDSPVDSIQTIVVHIRADGINIENTFENPTIKLDIEEKSLHPGIKCIEENWVPAITISKQNIEKIRLYIK
jgi:hypothetical protein